MIWRFIYFYQGSNLTKCEDQALTGRHYILVISKSLHYEFLNEWHNREKDSELKLIAILKQNSHIETLLFYSLVLAWIAKKPSATLALKNISATPLA